jgi:hypothetical protein
VPGPLTWARVIGDEPALILLDEMRPFFVSLGAKLAGPTTTEADRLALALANLMNAIVSGRLPNACLVLAILPGRGGKEACVSSKRLTMATRRWAAAPSTSHRFASTASSSMQFCARGCSSAWSASAVKT